MSDLLPFSLTKLVPTTVQPGEPWSGHTLLATGSGSPISQKLDVVLGDGHGWGIAVCLVCAAVPKVGVQTPLSWGN